MCSMAATAEMNSGGECDLLERLMDEAVFGLSREEIEDIMKPELYIGRCSEQVSQYLARKAPLIEGIDESSAVIEV